MRRAHSGWWGLASLMRKGETEGATTGFMGWLGLLLLALASWGFTRCPNGRPISRLLKATSSFLLAKQEQTKRPNREPPASPTYAPQSECVLSYSPSCVLWSRVGSSL